ncbi:MAG: aminotransferase class V-fold PLP-dependent enzyme [Ruminococcus sp.]|nr:aminotransferase class V-fold PLP-dependent enzyme [Ruminococcus sp.]
MKSIINFDNAATSFPKPPNVKNAVLSAIENCGGSPGRGGHILAMRSSELVYQARAEISDFFDAQPENVIFCYNCTHALNTAINGTVRSGMHVITSSLEHNSVIRPLIALKKEKGISITVVEVSTDDQDTVDAFSRAIRKNTGLVICTVASNVTGQRLPVEKIAQICHEKNICFIADGAQACGHIPVSLKKSGINILCTSGHKGLYGISGTGLLISDGKYNIEPLIYGGTGSLSTSMTQPDFMPDSLESGTLNIPGILSVKAGIEFLKNTGIENIHSFEKNLSDTFVDGINDIKGIKIYRCKNAEYLPVVSFNLKDIPSERLSSYLSENGFCLRAGLHCSALAHETLGTKTGTVRFSPSFFNSVSDVKNLCYTLKNASYAIEKI